MALQPFVGPWMGDQPLTRPLPTHRATHTDIHASSGIRTRNPVLGQVKTVRALGSAATVIRIFIHLLFILSLLMAQPVLLTITDSMELSTTQEATGCAATREPPSILWNPKVHYLTI
jgi:hypothetical protein